MLSHVIAAFLGLMVVPVYVIVLMYMWRTWLEHQKELRNIQSDKEWKRERKALRSRMLGETIEEDEEPKKSDIPKPTRKDINQLLRDLFKKPDE